MIIRGSIGSGLSGGSSSFNGGFGSSETATAGGGFSGNLINRSFDKMNNMQSLAKPTITNLDTASGNNPTHNMNLNGVDDGLSLK
jgi:hypothetical protein